MSQDTQDATVKLEDGRGNDVTVESTACFKCGGNGRLRRKRKRQPGEQMVAGEGVDDTRIISVGTKSVQEEVRCTVCQGGGRIFSRKRQKAEGQAGIITPCYRPPGYVSVGPQPRPLGTVQPQQGEALCCLTGDWRILQPVAGHRYSTDDVVTAWVAGQEVRGLWAATRRNATMDKPSPGAPAGACEESSSDVPVRGLDLGCGLGSVLLMMCWQLPSATYVGVEAQQTSLDRARRSAYANACDERVDIRHGDIRDIRTVVPEGAVFDVVTGTPPYFDPFGAEASSLPPTDPQPSLPPPPLPQPPPPPPLTSLSSPSSPATPSTSLSVSAAAAAEATTAVAAAAAPQALPSPAVPGGPLQAFTAHSPQPPLPQPPVPSTTTTTTSQDTPIASQASQDDTSTLDPKHIPRRASGKLRDCPVPLPVATDQRPSNFEYRGGIEVYCQGAKACLARGGLFIVCAGERYGGGRRVPKAAEDAGLTVLRKVEVVPKESQPPLFSVYTMCLPADHHAFCHLMDTHTSIRSITRRLQMQTSGDGTHTYTRAEAKASSDTHLSESHARQHLEQPRVCAIGSKGNGSGRENSMNSDHAKGRIDTIGSPPVAGSSGAVGGACGSVHGVCVVVETVVVRRADGRRTDAYVRLMADLGMPDGKGAFSNGGDGRAVDV